MLHSHVALLPFISNKVRNKQNMRMLHMYVSVIMAWWHGWCICLWNGMHFCRSQTPRVLHPPSKKKIPRSTSLQTSHWWLWFRRQTPQNHFRPLRSPTGEYLSSSAWHMVVVTLIGQKTNAWCVAVSIICSLMANCGARTRRRKSWWSV